MSYDQAQADINENEASSSGSALTADFVNTFQEVGDFFADPTVCVDVDPVSNGPARTPASRQDESPAPAVGQDILVKKCHKKAVAPCVQSVVVNGNSVGTTVLLPVNESITLTVGPQKETIKRLAPKKGAAPGSDLTISGTNLTQVSAVYIDGDPVSGTLIGGVQASIVSETARKLVVTVPPGASTGPVTLIGWSGDVTSSSTFNGDLTRGPTLDLTHLSLRYPAHCEDARAGASVSNVHLPPGFPHSCLVGVVSPM